MAAEALEAGAERVGMEVEAMAGAGMAEGETVEVVMVWEEEGKAAVAQGWEAVVMVVEPSEVAVMAREVPALLVHERAEEHRRCT